MKTACLLAAAFALTATHRAGAAIVTPVVDTGVFNPYEMALDPANGDIYLAGFATGSGDLSIKKVSGGTLATLYATLPGTYNNWNLTYTNGFAVHGSNLWWNNANSGLGTMTEISRAPKAGGGPITRNAPTNDLDALASDGTTLFSAYYAGNLCTVDGNLNVTYFSQTYRSTSHLTMAAEAGILYVADDSGIYRRNTNGSYTSINTAAGRYLTNGSRMGVGDGYLYALDRTTRNGYWKIDKTTGAASFTSDANFTYLNGIAYYNGDIYVSDTGEASGQPNTNGHVWKISNSVTLAATAAHGTLTGAGAYAPGATASLGVTPHAGYVFVNWSGDATGSDNPLSVLMNSNKSITAVFGEDPADPDLDGLTNYQESVVYGTNPEIPDTDADGFADGFEVTTGYSPTSNTSSPESKIAIHTAVEVEFGASLGRTYRIESSTDLVQWLPVESGIVGTGGMVTRLYSVRSTPKRYFRAVRE